MTHKALPAAWGTPVLPYRPCSPHGFCNVWARTLLFHCHHNGPSDCHSSNKTKPNSSICHHRVRASCFYPHLYLERACWGSCLHSSALCERWYEYTAPSSHISESSHSGPRPLRPFYIKSTHQEGLFLRNCWRTHRSWVCHHKGANRKAALRERFEGNKRDHSVHMKINKRLKNIICMVSFLSSPWNSSA